jgi:hypothetical protein
MARNEIKLHIEADGQISVSSDDFDEELHLSAEKFIKETFKALGGTVKVEHKDPLHAHTHIHDHIHSH